MDLYKKHDQEKENYNVLRDKTWADMKQRHNNLISAFQSKENLPEGYAESMDKEIEQFNKDWSMPDGRHYKNMILQQEQQLDTVTRFLEPANDLTEPNEQSTSGFFNKLASTKELDKEAELDKEPSNDNEEIDRFTAFKKNMDDVDL